MEMNKDNIINITANSNINLEHISTLNKQLGVDIQQQLKRNLVLFPEEAGCIDVGLDFYKRSAKMLSEAALAWHAMVKAAASDNINLYICSAFRSYEYQANLIQRKLDMGQVIDEIISVLAPPGFSEHHTGRAVDIITDDMKVLDQSFADTHAFVWLTEHAAQFNFIMSYPKDNPHGIIYEPWHWCYHF